MNSSFFSFNTMSRLLLILRPAALVAVTVILTLLAASTWIPGECPRSLEETANPEEQAARPSPTSDLPPPPLDRLSMAELEQIAEVAKATGSRGGTYDWWCEHVVRRSRRLDLGCPLPNSTVVLPVLITGTGRSGTTFLSSQLVRMGLDLPHVSPSGFPPFSPRN